jgi:cytochrome c553
MRGISESLSDQDMADLAAYYSVSGEVQGAAALPDAPAATGKAAELLAKGNCASCHGANYNAPIAPGYPKIAGQHSDYLYVALKAYKTEGNPKIGRSNAVMGGIAKQFSNAELKVLANYMGSIPGALKVVPQDRFR